MIRHVPLAELPPGLEFPPDLQHRIRYDSAKHQLSFDGFMSKTDFDRLERLHRDIQYQRALENLFRICTIDPPTPARKSHRWLWGSVCAATVLVVLTLILVFRR